MSVVCGYIKYTQIICFFFFAFLLLLCYVHNFFFSFLYILHCSRNSFLSGWRLSTIFIIVILLSCLRIVVVFMVFNAAYFISRWYIVRFTVCFFLDRFSLFLLLLLPPVLSFLWLPFIVWCGGGVGSDVK